VYTLNDLVLESAARDEKPQVIKLAGVEKVFLSGVRKAGKKIGPIDLSVQPGEMFGLVGSNGSGKSTCIKMILGLVNPSAGIIELNGFDPVFDHDLAVRGVGYSPELPNLQSFLTPRELLKISAELAAGYSRGNDVEDEIERVLSTVDMKEEQRDVKIAKLSKGTVQKLSIAQAILGEPRTLVLDEPMAGLDPVSALKIRRYLREFTQAGGTVLLSSHVLSDIEEFCDKVALIHEGKVLAQGTVEDVLRSTLKEGILTVEASKVSDSILQEIRALEGVEDIRMVEISGGVAKFEILLGNAGAGIRPRVNELLVKGGAQVFTLKREERLLEKAYIRAIGETGV
jgi:ABC-type multidrug transport system ATPase subunit